MQLVSSAGLVPTSARSLPKLRLFQPRSVAETLAALGQAEKPVLLSGGTDLVARFNEGLDPAEIVSLAQVAELRSVTAHERGLRIGAAVTHDAGCNDPAVRARAPGFAHAWSRIANPRVRFTATLGGNLMALRPRYEGSLLLMAARARLEIASAAGLAEITPADLWAGRAPARSLLTTIVLDTADLAWYAYERSMRPLITLAGSLHYRADGLELVCAVGTEYLRPVLLELPLPGATLGDVVRSARDVADRAFAQLPAAFADPVVTHAYCTAAGTTLLARQLAGIAHV
jgi:carbon-monoxide dehydrogenase medium subunit